MTDKYLTEEERDEMGFPSDWQQGCSYAAILRGHARQADRIIAAMRPVVEAAEAWRDDVWATARYMGDAPRSLAEAVEAYRSR